MASVNIETFNLFWLKCSKQKMVFLLQLWDLRLNEKIPLTTSEMFKSLGQKEIELIIFL